MQYTKIKCFLCFEHTDIKGIVRQQTDLSGLLSVLIAIQPQGGSVVSSLQQQDWTLVTSHVCLIFHHQFSQCNSWIWGARRGGAGDRAEQHSLQSLQQQTQCGLKEPVYQCWRTLLGSLRGCPRKETHLLTFTRQISRIHSFKVEACSKLVSVILISVRG